MALDFRFDRKTIDELRGRLRDAVDCTDADDGGHWAAREAVREVVCWIEDRVPMSDQNAFQMGQCIRQAAKEMFKTYEGEYHDHDGHEYAKKDKHGVPGVPYGSGGSGSSDSSEV